MKSNNIPGLTISMKSDMHEIKDKALFNAIASIYIIKDIYPVSSEARKFQLLSMVELYADEYEKKEFDTVVELGCGIGASVQYLKGLYRRYIGIDYSDEFIKLAKAKYRNGDVEYICANIKDINLNIKNIDFIFGVGILHHVSDIKSTLKNISRLGDHNTIYGFIEPQSGNPIVQLLRKMRMKIDKYYSNDQIFFNKKDINKLFNENGFDIIKIKYQGYFTPPFAQVVIKPVFIFKPIVKLLIKLDLIIQKYINNPLSWNIVWIAKKK